ncbi:MAG: hypothetical protein KAG53_03145 [Endozoicomonadaceae bacterium]|nr:hypothetical protein [Endozoicomonadaceae bacterium]
MSALAINQQMLETVAQALGEELLQTMTFVGGCTTGLLLTDAFTREQVRHTDDVDLIVHVMGYLGFSQLQEQLKKQGFVITIPDPDETWPICAMKLGELRVDFMPDDETILGFGNRWYKAAMATAIPYALTKTLTINLVSPLYFIATKLEAFKGRGKGDVLASRDIEDILNLLDGRSELVSEIQKSETELQHYIATEISQLLALTDFEYAVASQAKNSQEREDLIFERLDLLAAPVSQEQP